ncbi:NAD-dependent epimerase/dehydratase family protein [Herbiconiux sp.]|uniref:NAD-dependent epimerase/dehydratase family protein n=1 Tax=Herbiconiux sp. TaxID=1871186 RepID=UPI0025C2B903|nr:NAD-dependent epimerase/dehydratase family protein [Herbiconiux sp.]
MTKTRVLVTGAVGYIGQAVSQRLQIGGYAVSGLSRSRAGLRALDARGITPVQGDLDDAPLLERLAGEFDVIVDTATADHAESTAAFLRGLDGSGKTYVRTSGTGVYTDLAHGAASDAVFTEETPHIPAEVVATRYASDAAVQAAAERNIRTVVIRPSMIYGDGASEQLPLLIRRAIISNRSVYVGDGLNRWSNVYLPDLAEVYALALEKAPAGSVYNIGSGEAAMADIAGAVATLIGLGAAESCSAQEAFDAFGQRWVEVALSSNSRVDSTKAREELGWNPLGPSLLEDLTYGSYKRVWSFKGDPHDHAPAAGAGH